MIFVVLYAVIAAASTFAFIVGKLALGDELDWEFCGAAVPILCGVFWPIGWITYGPYLAARWYMEKKEDKK